LKSVNIIMLTFALATTFSFMLIGISVAERSVVGIIASILLAVMIMGFGFKTKKSLREKGNL
jgi:hypothetical protein